jgi:YtfJ family uncharacterized protein
MSISRFAALVISGLLLSAPVFAGGAAVGAPLPDLAIDDRGEIILQGDDISYQAWRYPQQPGKVNIVQYLAATKSAGDMNKPFRDRLDTDLPKGEFSTTTILNMDDAIWGTGAFVMGELKSNKREFPAAVIVVDENGVGLQQWQLQNDSSALMVVDPQGIVRYFKQGKMSATEIDSTLQLILAQIKQSSTPSLPRS